MTKKNSLTAFKKPSTPILPTDSEHSQARPQPEVKGRVGRKAKPAAEKQKHRVTLSLTDREKAICDEKSGLVNNATHIHQFLKDQGYFD